MQQELFFSHFRSDLQAANQRLHDMTSLRSGQMMQMIIIRRLHVACCSAHTHLRDDMVPSADRSKGEGHGE